MCLLTFLPKKAKFNCLLEKKTQKITKKTYIYSWRKQVAPRESIRYEAFYLNGYFSLVVSKILKVIALAGFLELKVTLQAIMVFCAYERPHENEQSAFSHCFVWSAFSKNSVIVTD